MYSLICTSVVLCAAPSLPLMLEDNEDDEDDDGGGGDLWDSSEFSRAGCV